MLILILSVTYIIGFNICYWMLITEHKAEGNIYTIGDNIACLLLSLLSWAGITWALWSSWIGRIRNTGYWDRPVKESELKLNGAHKQKQSVK
jgi:hypothetical protein